MKAKLHYIGMNGTHGCLPDSCNVYESHANASDSLANLLELTEEQIESLDDSNYTKCTPEQGAEYCEIIVCNCDNPSQHEAN